MRDIEKENKENDVRLNSGDGLHEDGNEQFVMNCIYEQIELVGRMFDVPHVSLNMNKKKTTLEIRMIR